MFDDESEDGADKNAPTERATGPAAAAREKAEELRMHAELAAVFEGCRKFDAQLRPGLDADVARDIQRTMAKLAKSKTPESPVLPPASAEDAARLLAMPSASDESALSTNDYHIHRRPGEVMIVRWLDDDLVGAFYERLQAHFDAAIEGYKEEHRHSHGWKQDDTATAYLAELDKIEIRMADRWLREPIKQHKVFVLSDQTADEMNIAYLCDYIMGVPAAELVGSSSAPPDEPTEKDLAWFFKLFSLRGVVDDVERMCFFTFLQKTDDDDSW
jgi:hypothetical protein